jgi:hypothetical protein
MQRDYHVLRFPGRWKAPLRRLAQAQRGGDVASIPITSLNDAIAALVPDSVVTLKYAGRGDADDDWLLASRPINPTAIFNLVAAWVRAQRANADQIASTLAELRATDLRWSTVPVDFLSAEQRRMSLRVLPMEIAAALTQPDVLCPHGDLSFRRCNTDEGAEIISWPPTRIEEQTPFSVKIGISAQTLPTSDEPLVFLTFGVRRWMPVRGSLALDHGHSVYLAPTVPYLAGIDNSRHFGRARIKLTRTKDPEAGIAYLPKWDDALAQVLDQAGCLSRLPNPQQLADKPIDYLQREGDAIALVYSTGMLSRERVSPGLSLADREPLMDWATQALRPHLHLMDLLQRASVRVYRGRGKDTDLPAVAADLAQSAREVVGDRLDVELHTDTTAATEYALDALSARLGATTPTADSLGDQHTLIEVGSLTVGIRRPALRIASPLDRDGTTVAAAVEARIAQIEAALPNATHPTVALVEVDGLDVYSGPRRREDPKFAVRHGLLRARRLSQFITPVAPPKRPPREREGREPSDPNLERFAEAIDDLFRQLGVRPQPLPQPAPATIARQPALLGIRLIRQNKGRVWGISRQVPVAVLIDPNGQHVQVRAPQVDWQPLHTGLIEIGKRYLNADLKYGPDDVVRFIEEAITDVVGLYTDTLLLTHAQNLRTMWPAISNTNLQLDTLGFGAGGPQPIAKFPGLRHVRVRTADGGETPQCFGVTDTESGQPQGLWRYMGERVFGSTGSKPSTATGALMGISKIVPNEYGDRILAPNPGKQVWNQQFVELLVAAIHEGDQPQHWAALAHDLRRAASYVDVTTVLPWPLHLAAQIEEYLLPVKISYVGEEDAIDTE